MDNIQNTNYTLAVDDINTAVKYYTEILQFRRLCEDTENGWVRLASPSEIDASLLLTEKKELEFGSGMPIQNTHLVIVTDDIWQDYMRLKKKGVRFLQKPRKRVNGLVALFEDVFGNTWELVQIVGGLSALGKMEIIKMMNDQYSFGY